MNRPVSIVNPARSTIGPVNPGVTIPTNATREPNASTAKYTCPNRPGNIRAVDDADRLNASRLAVPDTAQNTSKVTASGCRPDLITIMLFHPRFA